MIRLQAERFIVEVLLLRLDSACQRACDDDGGYLHPCTCLGHTACLTVASAPENELPQL